MNLKPSRLAVAISTAFALSLPVGAGAHEGHAHPGQTWEDVSRPDNNLGRDNKADQRNHIGDQRPGHEKDRTPPIPEPETYALMLAGLGLLAAAIGRRRK